MWAARIPKRVEKTSGLIAVPQGGIFLHASAVCVLGRALLFLGHSGSGKSTISQLLAERFPRIADDKVLVFKTRKGIWLVRDASGSYLARIATGYTLGREKFPLLGMMRIFKSRSLRLVPLSPRKTCHYLMDAMFELDIHRNNEEIGARKRWFRAAVQISRNSASWSLTFPKSKSIIKKVSDAFGP